MRSAGDAAIARVGPALEAEAAQAGPGFWALFLDDAMLLPRRGPSWRGGEPFALEEIVRGVAWPEEDANASDNEQQRQQQPHRGAPPPPPPNSPFLDSKPFRPARLTVNRILAGATDWRTPLTVARDCGALMDEIGAACACHRLAKLSVAAGVSLEEVRAHPGFDALTGAVAARVPTFMPRQTANVLWALGKLGDRESALLPALVETLPSSPWAEWREQELANALWACGALQLADWPAAWAPLAREVGRRGLARFETQAVSNIVWACA